MAENILQKIITERKKSFKAESAFCEKFLPKKRTVPLVKFFTRKPFIIGELKKASPSKGVINNKESYENIIKEYQKAGIKNFSVLTEQNYFSGNLQDLFLLKKKYPRLAFLRKDFLFCRADIDLAYRAGADAILLIAALLTPNKLNELIKYAYTYNLDVLCEVHSLAELKTVLKLRTSPTAVGINCRDLKTFKLNKRIPLKIRPHIPASICTVYESGIDSPYIAELAGNARFNALLIGEKFMTAKGRTKMIGKYLKTFKKANEDRPNFFTKLYSLKKERYLKICGITNMSDAQKAAKYGADILGFVCVESSPRKIALNKLKQFKKLKSLKVAVVKDPTTKTIKTLKKLLKQKIIDGIQFHGQEQAELIESFGGNSYKAISVKDKKDILQAQKDYQPVFLTDTPFEKNKKTIPAKLLKELTSPWLAGGLTAENVKKIVTATEAELIDVASGIEKTPGKKDLLKLKKFITEVQNV